MVTTLSTAPRRKIVRRALRGKCRCLAIRTQDFRLIGERVLDVSPFGMMIACDEEAQVGEEVVVAFELDGQRPGGPESEWYDAIGEVARVIEGYRDGDQGYCIGLKFTEIPLATRMALRKRLVGVPPPVPSRPLRIMARSIKYPPIASLTPSGSVSLSS